MNTTELINRAQSDLNDFGQVSAVTAQALINALIEATSKDDRVLVCNKKLFKGKRK